MHIWKNINSTQLKSYDPTAAGTEIGSGPFIFQSWVKGSTISLTRNPGYFRTPWWEYSTPVTPSSNSFSTTITQGSAPISNATVVLNIGNSSTPVETVTLTGGSNGVYSGSIPTSQLQNALYEATVNATYTAGGTQHEALRFSAISVSGVSAPTSQTTQPTSSSTKQSSTTQTTTSTFSTGPTGNSTITLVAAVVVVVIAIAGVAGWLLRRRPKPA